MGGCVTEEQDIACRQYLDLVYWQSGTLCEMFLDALRPSSHLTASKSPNVPPVDGVIGLVSQTSVKAFSKRKYVLRTGSNNPLKNSSSLGKTFEIHVVQCTKVYKASKGMKRAKVKPKLMLKNRTHPNHLLMMLLKESLNILASSVRIFIDAPMLINC